MTSSINPFTIDSTYPIAGQDNDTQGFRDNFTGIQDNFVFTKSEIETLQTGSASITSTNDFAGNIISNAELQDNSLTVVAKGPVTGVITFDHTAGHVQTLTTTGNVIFAFTGWPAVGKQGKILVEVTVAGDYNITLPGTVVTPPDFVISVDGNATYWYEFVTRDSGATITLFDRTRSYGANTGDLNISGNTISTISTNTDINITPNGTGNVNIGSEIVIDGNSIRTANTNANIQLLPAGTGNIELGTEIVIDGNSIRTANTNANINLDPSGTGNLVLLSGNLELGSGNINTTGTITSDEITLPNNTSLLMKTTDGVGRNVVFADASNNLLFGDSTNWVTARFLNNTVFDGNITGSQLAIQGNQIVSLNTNADIQILPAGTGQVQLDTEIAIEGNTIKTINTNSNLILEPAGTGGVVTPGFLEIGDPGVEAGSITVGGIPYPTVCTVNDIGGTNPAQFVIHRHSTTLPAVLLGARSNSNTASHVSVTNNQNLLSIHGAGWTGVEYNLFGSILYYADATGTISNSSAPGKIVIATTPDGAILPSAAITIDSNQNSTFSGDITGTQLAIQGNDFVSLNTNSDINLTPAGTGIISLTGGQLKFPSIWNSSSDANILDDYEENTFVPNFVPSANAFTALTYDIQTGFYTKIGNFVSFSIQLDIATFTLGAATGTVFIEGLPFTALNIANYVGGALVVSKNNWTTQGPEYGWINANNDQISLQFATATGSTSLPVGNINFNSQVMITGTYHVIP